MYNGEKYLRECIESALNQRLKDGVEIIVVNDGSTDNTINICMEYGDKIKYIYKKNGGTASALNAGIAMAKGHFIKWLSADDVLLEGSLLKMFLWIRKNCEGRPVGDAIYYTNYHIIDRDSVFLRDFVEPGRPESDLWKRYFANGSTWLFHRDIIDKIGNFDAELPHSEDYEFLLRATMLHGIKLQLIPIFTLNYRNHPDQLTNKVGGSLDNIIKKTIRGKMG